MISKQCRAHLEEVNETAIQHMLQSFKTAGLLMLCIPMLIIHGFAPRLFTHTTTNILKGILGSRCQ